LLILYNSLGRDSNLQVMILPLIEKL